MITNRIDHAGNVALRKVGNPPGYAVCGWEVLDDGSVLYHMRHNQAPGKWTGPEKTACVSEVELDAERVRYESETGNCCRCDGTGQEWGGWDYKTGDRWVPCRRCGATGKAPQQKEVAP